MFESKNYATSDFLQPLIEKQYVKNVSLFNFKHNKMNLHKYIFVRLFKVSFISHENIRKPRGVPMLSRGTDREHCPEMG